MRELITPSCDTGNGDALVIVLAGKGPVFSAGHDFADITRQYEPFAKAFARGLRGGILTADVTCSSDPALRSFVTGLRRDQDAVTAGPTIRWSWRCSWPGATWACASGDPAASVRVIIDPHLSITRTETAGHVGPADPRRVTGSPLGYGFTLGPLRRGERAARGGHR
jgi:hypothetical protein